MNSRPVGVTILSILWILNGAFYAALAVLSIVNYSALAALLRAISPGGAGPAAVHLAMGRFGPVYYCAMILFIGVLAWGFWKLWNWTRVVTLALIGVNLLAVAIAPFAMARSGSSAFNLVPVARIVASVLISLLIGWYLLSARVRAAFRPVATARQSELPNAGVSHAR